MPKFYMLMMSIGLIAVLLCPSAAWAGPRDKVMAAEAVLRANMDVPDNCIPQAIMQKSQGLAILPNVIKAGFAFGGQIGSGIIMIRDDAGYWSNPVMINLVGGSFGWQIGVQSTDVILVFTNRQTANRVISGRLELGADAAAVAGPVGRRAEAGTDITLQSQVFSYSRSRGAFLGVSLQGSILSVDNDATMSLYGQNLSLGDILSSRIIPNAPPEVELIRRTVTQYSQ